MHPTPQVSVSADSTGVTGEFFVSADSKGVISPLLATLTKTAGVCTNNSQSGTPRARPGERGPADILPSSTSVSVNSVLSADSVLIPGSPHSPLFTDHCPLSPIPFLFTFLRTLLHCAKSYLLFFHAILDSLHKTPGGGAGSITKTKRKMAPSRPGRDKFRLPLQGDSQENEGCRRYGAARRGRRKRKKASGLESRQTWALGAFGELGGFGMEGIFGALGGPASARVKPLSSTRMRIG